MPASIRSANAGKNTGGTIITLIPPPGIVAGDLWIVAITTGTANGYPTDNIPKRWWKPDGQAVNTRQYSLFARIYNPSDPTSEYSLTQNASAGSHWAGVAISGHAVTQVSDIVLGTKWLRGSNGGSQGPITAPGITTPVNNMLILATILEASNAVGGWTYTAQNGFTLAVDSPEGGTANADIEWTSIHSKFQSVAGATGPMTVTFGTAASLNGLGQQIAIPSSAVVSPSTGQIGARVASSITPTSITMGVDRTGGEIVEVEAMLGATSVGRQAVTIDTATGWGSTTFTSLSPDAYYGFRFYVDGALQTDTEALIRTHPTPGKPTSFKYIAGSCQFTGSNHPIWDRILEEQARGLGHMGDLTYADTTDLATWRAAVESSLTAPRFRSMLGILPMTWTWDNHDRIIVDEGGAGNGLNFGKTDPVTLSEWKKLSGGGGWASGDSAGRTWVIGRVRFIQTDNWTNKTDPDSGFIPANQQTFLGAAQKQWFKDTLDAATEPIIVWLAQWTTATTGSGRWNSYNAETAELEAFINARPAVKAKMVMIGGDSHSVNVTNGSRTEGNFDGIPSFNISGFNRSSATGHGGTGWTFDAPLRTAEQPEPDWGGYSRLSFSDTGTDLTLLWEAIRVGPTGTVDVMNTQTITKTGLDPAWAVLDLFGIAPGTNITAANTGNFFDMGYPPAGALTAAAVTGGGIGMRPRTTGYANTGKSLVGHTESGRIGFKYEFLSVGAATSYAEFLGLKNGSAILADTGLRNASGTREAAHRGAAFAYIGQANGNPMLANEKWSFEVFWQGNQVTTYVWDSPDTSGAPTYTWGPSVMTSTPDNFYMLPDSADTTDYIMYDVWVTDGARRSSTPIVVPGTLDFVSNIAVNSTGEMLDISGRAIGADDVSIRIGQTVYPATMDFDGYWKAQAFLGLGASIDYEVLVDDVIRRTESVRTLPSGNTLRILVGSCFDTYTSGFFANALSRNPDLILDGGDHGYFWLSTSANGPTAPADPAAIRGLKEPMLRAAAVQSLYGKIPSVLLYSDCDGAGANSDSTFSGFTSSAVQLAHRQIFAHGGLPMGDNQGRVIVWKRWRIVATDELTMASDKMATDDANKTKLGATQKAWFKNQIDIAASLGQAIVWFGDGPFHPAKVTSGTSNEWSRYDTERQELANYAKLKGVNTRMARVNGDRHALGADTGANNPFGNISTVNAAPFHTTANPLGLTADQGSWPTAQTNSSRQYAILELFDDGEDLIFNAKGYSSTNSAPTEVQRFDMTRDFTPLTQEFETVIVDGEDAEAVYLGAELLWSS